MRDQLYNELVAFLIRETGWALEYVRELDVVDLRMLTVELRYQKAMDEYRRLYDLALIFSIWVSSSGRRSYKPEQFIGEMPQRPSEFDGGDIWKLATKAGIRIPEKRT